MADGLQHLARRRRLVSSQHGGDAVLAALGDHVGGAELAAEVGAGLVPAHQDDALGTELAWPTARPAVPPRRRR